MLTSPPLQCVVKILPLRRDESSCEPLVLSMCECHSKTVVSYSVLYPDCGLSVKEKRPDDYSVEGPEEMTMG